MSDRSARATSQLSLSTCDREPIHVPGTVQPHGVLVVLHPDDLTIVQATANIELLAGDSAESVIGQTLAAVLGRELDDLLRRGLEILKETPVQGRLRSHYLGRVSLFNSRLNEPVLCDVISHIQDAGIVIEFEFADDTERGHGSEISSSHGVVNGAHPLFGQLMRELDQADTIAEMGVTVCREVYSLTGFDRVLIYQFEESWDGKVVSEHNSGRLPSYLHHRFPATDIPAQARELYRTNPLRIIPSAVASPVRLVPQLNRLTGKPLDMTWSVLRSVSPIHIEYMRNMDTEASMSISILRRGRLWGLIACHHRESKRIPYLDRLACEHFSQAFSLRLSALEHAHDFERHVQVRKSFANLLASLSASGDFVLSFKDHPQDLLTLTGSQGAAVLSEQELTLFGQTPTEKQVRELGQWLFENNAEEVYATDALVAHYAPAAAFRESASGLLAISTSKLYPRFVMWFRPEVIQTIQWAGEPHKQLRRDGESESLHPRNSFETWKESIRDRSLSWDHAELDGASELRNAIVGIVLRKAEELASVNEELRRSNRELEAFSYSVSHDLRAPLRHIVGYAEILRASAKDRMSPREDRCLSTIIESSEYAGRLVDKLLAYSRLGQASLQCVPLNLNLLFEEVRKDSMRDAEGRDIDWRISPMHDVLADVMMLRMAARDLVSNAVKYTRNREKAVIEIGSREEGEQVVVWVKDNGVGFDMKYADKLFGVFQRLHRWEDYEGTGIGLANVRRVIERHGGFTWAEATEGVGATFYMTLPKAQSRESSLHQSEASLRAENA